MSTGPKTLEGHLKALANLKGMKDKDIAAISATIRLKRPVRVGRRYVRPEPSPAMQDD